MDYNLKTAYNCCVLFVLGLNQIGGKDNLDRVSDSHGS